MPCNLAPDFYERASYETSTRADDFLMSLDNTKVLGETGSVTSSLGHVSLVKITRDMIAEYVSAAGDPWMSERRNFEPGWYIVRVREEKGGVKVAGIGYGGSCDEHYGELCADTHSESQARADFAEAVETYCQMVEA